MFERGDAGADLCDAGEVDLRKGKARGVAGAHVELRIARVRQ
jgi:hypothetical protein